MFNTGSSHSERGMAQRQNSSNHQILETSMSSMHSSMSDARQYSRSPTKKRRGSLAFRRSMNNSMADVGRNTRSRSTFTIADLLNESSESIHSCDIQDLEQQATRQGETKDLSATGESLNKAKREYVSIHDDVYNLFLLSELYGTACFYSVYVFLLKMALYTFLALEVTTRALNTEPTANLLVAQFLMIPVAVAMQDDLTATFYIIANIKYEDTIHPNARLWKYFIATGCRAIDGFYSLAVNFIVLLSAGDIQSLFLNFAALQFLQTIDNIALDLAADGYLSDGLEAAAIAVQQAALPKRSSDNWLRSLDTVLYSGTVAMLAGIWALVKARYAFVPP